MQNTVGYLLITNVPPSEWRAMALQSSQLIGRHPDCDIIIPGKYRQVSRKHAQLDFQQNRLWIQDLGSSGGTQLNGVPLISHRQTRLVIGDRILLSDLELYFVSSEASILKSLRDASLEEKSLGATRVPPVPMPKSVSVDRLKCLSPSELEVVRWVCRGLTTDKEIGQQLFRSPNTVRTQLCSIFQKLDVHSREQLIALLKQREIAWTKSEDLIDGTAITDEALQTQSESDHMAKR